MLVRLASTCGRNCWSPIQWPYTPDSPCIVIDHASTPFPLFWTLLPIQFSLQIIFLRFSLCRGHPAISDRPKQVLSKCKTSWRMKDSQSKIGLVLFKLLSRISSPPVETPGRRKTCGSAISQAKAEKVNTQSSGKTLDGLCKFGINCSQQHYSWNELTPPTPQPKM